MFHMVRLVKYQPVGCVDFAFDIIEFAFMPRVAREPIQVYLTPEERAALDAAARELGVSRSEALRRGIQAMEAHRYSGLLRDLVEQGYVTPPAAGPGAAPPSAPVAPLRDLLKELSGDRGERHDG